MAKKEVTPPTSTINCTYHGKIEKHCKNGAKELWNARHPDYPGVVGAGNSAHNAAKDFRVQLKWHKINNGNAEFQQYPTRASAKNSDLLAHVLPEVFGDPGGSVGFQSRMV
jgi:hypothetical protein